MIKLFFTAFLQVFFVSANTYFIASVNWIGVAVCSWLISFIWTLNVKRIAISNNKERIIYATGAMCGGLVGLLIAVWLWR